MMLPNWELILFCFVGSFLFFSFIFFIAMIKKRYDLIDVAWGLSFISIAVISLVANPVVGYSPQSLVTLLVFIWGLRLSIHIYQRWDKSDKEDKRYAELEKGYEKKLGGTAINMYMRVYIVQAILAVIVSLPVIMINNYGSQDLNLLSYLGLFVWLIGFIFEAVGDYQLQKYIATTKSKNKLMTKGLWRYTRHPNYFGEAVQWWGIFVIALATPYWAVALVGPIMITVLLLFVSGVPITERHFKSRPGWSAYAAKTSKFLPLPPKKG